MNIQPCISSTHQLIGEMISLGSHRQQIISIKLFGVVEAGGEVRRRHCHTLHGSLLIDLELFGVIIV